MKKILLLLVLIPFFSIQNTQASHYSGSDISLTCLGGNTYLVTVTYYRDCEGISAPTYIPISFTCSSNSAFNFTAIANKNPNTGNEITPNCSTVPTQCNGGTGYGVQEYAYQVTVTLAPCNYWEAYYSGCCRGPMTTVMSGSGYTISTELNNLDAPCNSTPVFSNKPVFIANNNQLLSYNNGAIDADGDSLIFSFYPPKSTITNNVSYVSPYSYTNFINSSVPITIDSTTGQITFKPNHTQITSTVMGVKVEEWRTINGTPTLIGTVHRENLLFIFSSSNANPVLAGMKFSGPHGYNPLDTIYSTTAFATDPVYFSFSGFDPDSINSGYLSHPERFSILWNNGITQASFLAHDNHTDSAWAELSWTPGFNDISNIPHCFTATVIDDACPYRGNQIYAYCISVTSPPPLQLGNDTTICINNVLTLDGGAGNFSFQWSTGDTSRYLTINASTLGTGIHTITLSRTGYGSTDTDSININVDACVGIDISEQQLDFSVKPNPSQGVFNVSISTIIKSDIQLEIFNSQGKNVYSEVIQAKQKDVSKRINLEGLSAGIYFIKIQQGNSTKTQKIVIQ